MMKKEESTVAERISWTASPDVKLNSTDHGGGEGLAINSASIRTQPPTR